MFIGRCLAFNGARYHKHQKRIPIIYSSFKWMGTFVNVPTMGDSISEGTIVDIVKGVGEAVSDDDVVIVLETDKVSVDVRSTVSGVVTKHFGQLEDTVNVGAPLFEVDENQNAGVSKENENSEVSKQNIKSKHETPTIQSTESTHRGKIRTPLIKFLGKRSLLTNSSAVQRNDLSISRGEALESVNERTVLFEETSTLFGHIKLSDAEIKAVNSAYHIRL